MDDCKEEVCIGVDVATIGPGYTVEEVSIEFIGLGSAFLLTPFLSLPPANSELDAPIGVLTGCAT